MKRIILVLALLATSACIHKTGGKVTPMERVTTDNAVLAQMINTVEQGTEAVVKSNLITAQTGAPVIAWCGNGAAIDQQVTAILQKGSTVSAGDYASIQGLVAQLTSSSTQLVQTGALQIKNPKSQQLITADIQAAANMAQVVLTEVQALTTTGGK